MDKPQGMLEWKGGAWQRRNLAVNDNLPKSEMAAAAVEVVGRLRKNPRLPAYPCPRARVSGGWEFSNPRPRPRQPAPPTRTGHLTRGGPYTQILYQTTRLTLQGLR